MGPMYRALSLQSSQEEAVWFYVAMYRALSMQSSQEEAVGVHGPGYRALSMQSSQEEAVGVHRAHVFSSQHAVLPGGGSGCSKTCV